MRRVAVLHQAVAMPQLNGVVKPAKPNGYRDSSADIAAALRRVGVDVITPFELENGSTDATADPLVDDHWSFPDSENDIQQAVVAGANVIWANTSLFSTHPIVQLQQKWQFKVVGQHPALVEKYEDKYLTNQLLRDSFGSIMANSVLLTWTPTFAGDDCFVVTSLTEEKLLSMGFSFPLVVKPVRGRGSEGVARVDNMVELIENARQLLVDNADRFGSKIMLEQFLSGEELTITVMPPGRYHQAQYESHWALPPVRRINHSDGIAPYNGVVAVMQNSLVLSDEEYLQAAVASMMRGVEKIAAKIDACMPIRVDCRLNTLTGAFQAFDINMKPNMTGPGRPNREGQDSLVLIAARAIGWNYEQLLIAMLDQIQ